MPLVDLEANLDSNLALDQEVRLTSTRFGIFDQMPIGVCVLRQDFKVLYWNTSLSQWSGLSKSQVLGQNLAKFFPHLKDVKYHDGLQKTFEQGEAMLFSCELYPHLIPCRLPDGQLRTQHTTVTAAPNATQKAFYAVLSIQDVTHLVQQVNLVGNRESVMGNRESVMGNRESVMGNR